MLVLVVEIRLKNASIVETRTFDFLFSLSSTCTFA